MHSLSDSQDYTIICSQNSCQRIYHNLNFYSRHLSREHSSGDTHARNLSNQTLDDNTTTIIEETDVIPDTATSDEDIDVETDLFSSKSKGPALSSYAATFVAQMYSASNATLSDVQSITCTKKLLDRIVDSLQVSTTSLLRTLSVTTNNENVVSLMKDFESARNVFDDLDNPYKMTKYFEDKCSLVKPTEIFLSHRADTTRRSGLVKHWVTGILFIVFPYLRH